MADPQLLLQRSVSALARSRRERRRTELAERPLTTFREWVARVPEPKTGPLDFARFPFQVELYDQGEWDREVVIRKATQIGVSAYLVRWSLFLADVRGWTVLYVFPKDAQLVHFSDQRLKTMIDRSPYLRSRVLKGHAQNKHLKQIGLGVLQLTGSESKTGLDSTDADALAFDEYDTLRQEHLPDAEKRVSGSLHGLIRRVGVPSIPDWGIDAQYRESDQRLWMVRCRRCSVGWQEITFEDNVDQRAWPSEKEGAYRVVCKGCRKRLDVGVGEWVAQHPGRRVRGYHASRLIVPEVAADQRGRLREVVKASKSNNPTVYETHRNKDLAEAYVQEEGRLSPEAIAAAQRDYLMGPWDAGYAGEDLVTMGVDVASVRALNVRISRHHADGTKTALWIGRVEGFNQVEDLMRFYNVKMAALDHLPDGRASMSLAQRFPQRAYLVSYGTDAQKDVLSVDVGRLHASVKRTEAIDATFGLVRSQTNLLPQDLPEGYVKEMGSLVRRSEEDPETGKRTVHYVRTGPDDFAHAEVYDVVATELWFFQQGVDAATRETLRPLDELVEFERSRLAEGMSDEAYHPGVLERGYRAGWDDDDEDGEAY